MQEILLDTKALWGLIVRGSVYSDFMYKIAKEFKLLIPYPAVVEVFMAIYKVFSNIGVNPARGLKAVMEAKEKLKAILNGFGGISASIVYPDEKLILEAIGLINERQDLFVKKGPKGTKWLRFFDAMIAIMWIKRRCYLVADDPICEKLSVEMNLKIIKLNKAA